MRTAARAGVIVAALAGVVAGGAVTLALQDERLPADAPEFASPAPTQVARRPEPPDTLLVWTPGRLPPGFAPRAGGLEAVRHLAVVRSGTAWLTESRSSSGAVVDRPPAGFKIPLELGAVDPAAYRRFLPPADRSLLSNLARGEVLLGQASAGLRGLGSGATLRFGEVTARVAGVLPDGLVGAHEVFASNAFAERLGIVRPRYALVEPAAGATKASVTAAIRRVLPAGTLLRVRAPGETPYFRHGDAVLPPIAMKGFFGEFAARPAPGGWMTVDRGWQRTHLLTADVPILGLVTCARALFPQLRGALEEVRGARLGHLIDPGDYGGCYAPRFLSRDPGAGISHHAYGAAIDLNVSANPFGRVPSMHPRLVAIFERWGFTWGGRWLVPDGMHFDFIRPVSSA